jgi:hypothetical protein
MAAQYARARAAVTNGAQSVLEISRQYVPVDTGDLASSGGVDLEDNPTGPTAFVSYTSGHAAFVCFGTGRRGAESGHGAPGIEYNPNWPGMSGTPYLRPALDAGRPDIRAAFQDAGFTPI